MIFKGLVTFITGAGSGIGREAAILFAKKGATVIATDVNGKGLEETRSLLPNGCKGEQIVLDVGDSKAVSAVISSVESRWDRIDIMVNLAGGAFAPVESQEKITKEIKLNTGSVDEPESAYYTPEFLHHITDDEFKYMLKIHLYGTFYCMRAAIPIMSRQGKGVIINSSSVEAYLAPLGNPHHIAANAAIIALTRNAAAELGPRGIRVNAVAPGAVNTPNIQDSIDLKMLIQNTPLQRIAEPYEVAETILFLASDASSFFTGQTLEPNGGIH